MGHRGHLPGPERPLTKPDHFRQFVGSRVRVKTTDEIAGRRSFTGVLESADVERVSVADPAGTATIPLDLVRRANLLAPNDLENEAEVSA